MKEEVKDDKLLDNIKTCELVDKRFKEADKYRSKFEEEWRECEDFYAGRHWKDQRRSFKNLIFPIVEQEIATLTDSIPGTDILSQKEEREEDAKMLEASVHFTYEQQNLLLKLVMATRSALKVGTGFLYVDFDPDADGGQGSTTIKNVPWEHVYLDPAATEIDEASFVGLKFPIRTEELKRRFPKFKDQIKAINPEEDADQSSPGSKEDRASYNVGRGPTNDGDKYKLEGMTVLEEAWLRDHTMVEISEEETAAEIEKETEEFFKGINPDIGRFEDHLKHIDAHNAQIPAIAAEFLQTTPEMVTPEDIEALRANDQEFNTLCLLIEDHNKIHAQYYEINPEGKKLKYTEGLRLVMKNGKTILYDGSAPVDDGMVPLVPFYCYKDENSIYGTGEVKHIIPAQKSFNEMDHAEIRALMLVGNPQYKTNTRSGIKPDSITNAAGKVYVLEEGGSLDAVIQPQIPHELSQRKMGDQQFMEIISGMNEASQGRRPGGITAAKAIERLQQQTNGRIRLKSTANSLYSLPRLGKLVTSRNAKYWTTERFMRISDSSTGEVKRVVYDPERIKDLEYEVRVVPGSLAGTDKEAQAEVLATYVDKGWIPAKVYFQIVDIPNKKKVLEALNEADEQAALLEQLTIENEQLKAQLQGIAMPAEAVAAEGMPIEAAMPQAM